MARILAYTSPARGHLFPLTPILDELRARGHEIADAVEAALRSEFGLREVVVHVEPCDEC